MTWPGCCFFGSDLAGAVAFFVHDLAGTVAFYGHDLAGAVAFFIHDLTGVVAFFGLDLAGTAALLTFQYTQKVFKTCVHINTLQQMFGNFGRSYFVPMISSSISG